MASAISVGTPQTIGPYRVLYELGRGGMGVVYRAQRADGTGGPVALKMPSEDMADLFGSVRREIHALGRLRHPGVVRIVEEGIERGVPWYAMELLAAQSLAEVLHLGNDFDSSEDFDPTLTGTAVEFPGNLAPHSRFRERADARADLGRALTIMYRLARVLTYIHSHGIVHRDLKPENVLVQAGDRPVLVDFGLMGQFRAHSGREVLEVAGFMAGTALYAAPEQARGELVDARADLYSFGVMLYEIVTGRPPFLSRSVREVLLMHLGERPVAPSTYVRGIPPVLENLILNLLEKRPGDRLGYAEDVAELLVKAGAEPDADFKVETASYLYRPEIVGRKDTIESFRGRLPDLRSGAGGFLMLGGESGIGKTSVVAAFAREATLGSFAVVTGECDPVGGQPLHPLRPLLRAVAEYCRGKLAVTHRVLGERLSVLREQEPALAALSDDDTCLPADVVSRRLFSDLADTLAAFAHERPLLLVLDDLQWADEITLRFLGSLSAQFFSGLPLLIVGTYRADEVGPELRALLDKGHLRTVLLGRLDDASVAEIVRSMLAAPDAPESFLRFLATQTEGNPFFVAEYLRTAVAEHLLFRQSGRWYVAGAEDTYGTLGLPNTIRELVARRIDRLSPLARRIAECAAVLGREVPEAMLMAMCGESDRNMLEGVADLIAQQVFESMDDGVRFVHDKLREAAYAHLADDHKAALHARAAEVIEKCCATDEQLQRYAAELAHHCELAGLRERAVGYYALAAEGSVARGACREAVHLSHRGLALDHAEAADGPSEERTLRHARWQRILSSAHYGLGDLLTSAEHARRSLGEVGVRVPRTSTGWWMRLSFEVARQLAHVALPRRSGITRAQQPALREIAFASEKYSEGCYFTAEKTVMLASGLLAVNTAERLGESRSLITAYSTLGSAMASIGAHRAATHYFDEARRLALETKDLGGLAKVAYSSSVLFNATCDWKRFALYLEDGIPAAREAGDHQVAELCETARGFYELYTGQLAASADTYAHLRDRARKRFNHQHEAWGHSGRALSLILMDRIDEALEGLDAAMKLLEGQNDRMSELIALAQRAHALLHAGRIDEACDAADAVFAMTAKVPFVITEMFRGYAVPVEVYLEVWSRIRGHDALEVERLRRSIRVLLRGLRDMSRHTPRLVPVTLRLMGVTECMEGHFRRGEKLLRKSIDTAARLQLPVDEGIGEYELLGHAVLNPQERSEHHERARAIFTSMGCDLYLRKLNERPWRMAVAVEGV